MEILQTTKYSKRTGLFYPRGVLTDYPDDSIDVSDEDYAVALTREPGEELDVVDGRLVIIAPQAPTEAELLAEAKADKLAEITAACVAAINGGFESVALGAPHTYPSNSNDQANLAVNVLSSFYPGLPEDWTTLQLCRDGNGAWSYLPHTAVQIQQVGADGKKAIMTSLTRKAQLQTVVASAHSLEAVQAVTWEASA